MPRAEVRDQPLHALAVCEQKQGAWTCDSAGLQLDLSIYGETRQVRLLDVPPEAALAALDFVKSETDKGKRFHKSLFDGYITVWGTGGLAKPDRDGQGYSAPVGLLRRRGLRQGKMPLPHVELQLIAIVG